MAGQGQKPLLKLSTAARAGLLLLSYLVLRYLLGLWLPGSVWASVLPLLLPSLFTLWKLPAPRKASANAAMPFWAILSLFMAGVLLANLLGGVLQNAAGKGGDTTAVSLEPLPLISLFVTACVLPAVLEELFFRATVQRLLGSYGRVFSVLFTSLLFTLMHTSLWDTPVVFILSILLGLAFQLTGSVALCIGLHFINNLFAYGMAVAHAALPTAVADGILFGVIALVALGCVCTLLKRRSFRLWRVRGRQSRPMAALTSPVLFFASVLWAIYGILRIVERIE